MEREAPPAKAGQVNKSQCRMRFSFGLQTYTITKNSKRKNEMK